MTTSQQTSYATVAAFRASTGNPTLVFLATDALSSGLFARLSSPTGLSDDGAIFIIDGSNAAYKRLFTGHVNAGWYGAKCDGSTDDTAALSACDAAAKALAAWATLPATPTGSIVAAQLTLTANWDFGYLDVNGRTHIQCFPGSRNDAGGGTWYGIVLTTYGQQLRNGKLAGNVGSLSGAISSGNVDTAALPHDAYTNASGTAVPALVDPVWANIVTGGCTLLKTTQLCYFESIGLYNAVVGREDAGLGGHVYSTNCSFTGIFGIWNSVSGGDYHFEGCSLQGVIAAYAFGDQTYVGHNGGLQCQFHDCNLGFSPVIFLNASQYANASPPVGFPNGIAGIFESCAIENIGECFAYLRPSTQGTGIVFESTNLDGWYTVALGSGSESGADGAWPGYDSNEYRRKYSARWGSVLYIRSLDGDKFTPPTGAPGYPAPKAALINIVDTYWWNVRGATMDIFNGSYDLVESPAGGIRQTFYDARIAYEQDAEILPSLSIRGNLLLNPERNSGLGIANSLVSGGNWLIHSGPTVLTPFSFSTLAATGQPLASSPMTAQMLEELGPNPLVIKVSSGAGLFGLPVRGNPVANRQRIFFKFWIICLTNGGMAYNLVASGTAPPPAQTTAYPSAFTWTKVKAIDISVYDTDPTNAGYVSINFAPTVSADYYLAGIMLGSGMPGPYNPNEGPTWNSGPTSASDLTSGGLFWPPGGAISKV
ncbi:hypothetical protein [Paraburkholderia sp.]|uniref:hypothetical protein n=1 Tax=Paraburkholderia sp. TaxID=1926495 RepID=UPI003D6DF51F